MKQAVVAEPLISLTIAVLFALGLLYKNWTIEIRDWIEAKVSQ